MWSARGSRSHYTGVVTKAVNEQPPQGGTVLVDASAYLFRAWFGVPDVFVDGRGRPLNAVVGFARTLAAILVGARPTRVAVAFDEALHSGFRHRIDPDYKAGRVLPDKSLAYQMKACRQLVEGLGICALSSHEFEADDLLAALAARERRRGAIPVLVGEDKDLAQLVTGPADALWQVARRRVLNRESVKEWLGLPPERLAECQALMGDAIDGISGVPGVGRLTAIALLRNCDDIEEILADPEAVSRLKIRGAVGIASRLQEHREQVRRNLLLTRLVTRVPGLPPPRALAWVPPKAAQVRAVIRELGLPAGSARHFEALRDEG